MDFADSRMAAYTNLSSHDPETALHRALRLLVRRCYSHDLSQTGGVYEETDGLIEQIITRHGAGGDRLAQILEEATVKTGLAMDATAFAEKGHRVYLYQLPLEEWEINGAGFGIHSWRLASAAELTYLPEYLFNRGKETR
jgi:hypothetical protein